MRTVRKEGGRTVRTTSFSRLATIEGKRWRIQYESNRTGPVGFLVDFEDEKRGKPPRLIVRGRMPFPQANDVSKIIYEALWSTAVYNHDGLIRWPRQH